MSEHQPDDLVGYAEIAELTGDSRGLLRYHRWAGNLPDPDRYFGRSPVWLWAAVEGWVRSRAMVNRRK